MVGGGLDWADAAGLFEADMLWLWVPGLAYALVLFLIGRRWSHFLIMPGSIVLCAALYHMAMTVAGVSLMDAKDLGILLPEGSSGNLWPTAYVGDLGRIDWAVVASQIPGMLTVVLVTLIAVLTNTSAIEVATGVEIDLDKDFRNAGIGNLAIALGGSAPGHYAVSLSVASRTAGAYSRLTGIMAAIVVCYVLFFGNGTIELIPLAMLGGLVLYLGLELLYTWAVSVRKKLPLVDYGIAVLILGVIATRGFLAGMGVGLAAAIFFFAMRLSRTDPVQATFTGRGQHRQSRRQRSLIHRAILSELGDRLHTYHLRGYMFFGIASPLVERLKSALRSNPPPQCVLLDFTAVTGFDVSAATALHRFTLAAKSQGTEVVFSAVPEHFEATLATIVPGDAKSGLHFEDDLDRGLERCEDIILAQWDRTQAHDDRSGDAMLDSTFDELLQRLEIQTQFEELTERLEAFLDFREYAAGEAVVERGQSQEGMLLLVRGRLTVRNGDQGSRLREHVPGDALGVPAAFSDLPAIVDVDAIEPSRLLLLTPISRHRLEKEDPELALDLYRYVMGTIE